MVAGLAVSNIQLCAQLGEHLDVGVEAEVQAIHIGALACALTLGITQ